MTTIGMLFFAGCAVVAGVVLAAAGLVLRSRHPGALVRWYGHGLLLGALVALAAAIWFLAQAFG